MQIKEEKPLIIPENCAPMEYLLIGFTKTDAAYVAALGVIGAVCGIALWTKGGNSMIGVAVFFLFLIIAISIFRRNEHTENLIDKIRILKEYKRSQKKLEHKYINIWETKGREMNADSGK